MVSGRQIQWGRGRFRKALEHAREADGRAELLVNDAQAIFYFLAGGEILGPKHFFQKKSSRKQMQKKRSMPFLNKRDRKPSRLAKRVAEFDQKTI